MPIDFASVQLHIPTGYFIRNLGGMTIASSKFKGMKISQGMVSTVTVTGEPEGAVQEVKKWVASSLPPA